ncbi:MAG: hypothetical protein ACI4N0_03980 [Christensenellales bacterium]
MLERGKLDRGIVEIVDAESMVPKDHLLPRTADKEVAETGYLFPKAVFIDGTHIKANANIKKPGENTSNMTRQQRFLLPTPLTRRPISAKGI